jgi:Flp pilus assembly CpaF family ATPase
VTSELERRLVAEVRDGLGSAVERDRLSAMDRRALAGKLIADGLQDEAGRRIAAGAGVLSLEEEERATRFVLDRIFLAGALQVYLDDPSVMELNAQGCDEVFVRYVDGRTERVDPISETDEALVELVRTLGREGMAERRFDAGCPRVSVQLPNGDRLFAAMAVCPRPVVSIRRHDFEHLATLDDQLRAGMIDLGLKELEVAAVKARKNIVVSGATGAGKTTHTRALANEIPATERVVTIEDCLELNLHRFSERHPQVVAFQEREANVEGEGAVSMAELVRWSLRLSPDRVIVGEVRGAEVIPMLLAMTMGTDGSLCTIHASSSKGAVGKLATYAAMSPERLGLEAANLLIAGAVHFVVHIAQRSAPGEKTRRFVSSVREVTGAEGPHVVSNEIYAPGPDGRAIPAAPIRSETLKELELAGFDPELLAQPGGWWQ